uniref:Uncharacterized protein n=1 Tax=Bracon brevicornis TaxID=1563983 RepID=A0A6V7HXN2_9HYME
MIKLINQEDDILTDLEAYITDVKERVEKSTRISKTFTDVLKEKTHSKFPNKL